MKFLYFGIYSKGIEYPRNNNLINGLKLNGNKVIEAHFELAGSFHQRMHVAKKPVAVVNFLFKLAVSYIVLAIKFIRSPRVDAVIVGHPGYFHIHLARILRFLLKKESLLVYDIFIPLYNAIIEDRQLLKSNSFTALLLHQFEASCCQQADLNLIDTHQHCHYIQTEYGVAPEQIRRIFVGSTIASVYKFPAVLIQTSFKILYVGTYIPLHGVDIILGAARKLKEKLNICFILAGSGQLKKKMKNLANQWDLTNVVFQDWVPTHRLGELIRSCHLSLGIFGDTSKAMRVIPSKVFDICAAGVPFITADTPAIREAFQHRKNAYIIPPKDAQALANAILELKNDSELRKTIAQAAIETWEICFAPKSIGNDLKKIIEEKQTIKSAKAYPELLS